MELREQSLNPEIKGKDQSLNEGQTEVLNVNQTEETTAEAAEKLSKEQIVELATELSAKPAIEISRDEITKIKQQFYSIRKAELEVEKAEFLEKGNEEAAFAPKTDELEEKFKEILNEIKEKKAALLAEQEATRQANYDRKSAIITEIIEMAADTDNVNRLFPKFKELQQEFKSIGEVPPTVMSELWKSYQDAVER